MVGACNNPDPDRSFLCVGLKTTTRILPLKFSLLSRRFEVMGARRKGAREARQGEVREAHDSTCFLGVRIFLIGRGAPEGKSGRAGRGICQ